MGVKTNPGKVVEMGGVCGRVQSTKEGILVFSQPRALWFNVISNQRCELEVFIPGPVTYLSHFLRCEEAEVGITSDEICLLTDRKAMMSDLLIR